MPEVEIATSATAAAEKVVVPAKLPDESISPPPPASTSEPSFDAVDASAMRGDAAEDLPVTVIANLSVVLDVGQASASMVDTNAEASAEVILLINLPSVSELSSSQKELPAPDPLADRKLNLSLKSRKILDEVFEGLPDSFKTLTSKQASNLRLHQRLDRTARNSNLSLPAVVGHPSHAVLAAIGPATSGRFNKGRLSSTLGPSPLLSLKKTSRSLGITGVFIAFFALVFIRGVPFCTVAHAHLIFDCCSLVCIMTKHKTHMEFFA